METTIQNAHISLTVSDKGAEMQSVKDLTSGREYLWQGDERWWNGRSPILFPATGGLWNGRYREGAAEQPMPKHGFVRRALWRLTEQTDLSLRYETYSTVGTYATYPHAYILAVTYRLQERTVAVEFEVKNTGGDTLLFQIGGHPAIALPDWDEQARRDGYLDLEGHADHVLRVGEQGCALPEHHPCPTLRENLVPVETDTFAHEALIFDEGQLTGAAVLDKRGNTVARVRSQAPVWLFWSPQGQHSPFVCLEPWYGLCDSVGFEGQLSERPYIQQAAPGQTWTGGFTLEVF